MDVTYHKPREALTERDLNIGLTIDLFKAFPKLTETRDEYRKLIYEFLWYLKGDTNVLRLEEKVKSRFNGLGFTGVSRVIPLGEVGVSLGSLWRRYRAINARHAITETDQLRTVLRGLQDKPGEIMSMTTWSPDLLPDPNKTPNQNIEEGRSSIPIEQSQIQFRRRALNYAERIYLLSRSEPDALSRYPEDLDNGFTDLFLANNIPSSGLEVLILYSSPMTTEELKRSLSIYILLSHVISHSLEIVPLNIQFSVAGQKEAILKDPFFHHPSQVLEIKNRNRSGLFDYRFSDFIFKPDLS